MVAGNVYTKNLIKDTTLEGTDFFLLSGVGPSMWRVETNKLSVLLKDRGITSYESISAGRRVVADNITIHGIGYIQKTSNLAVNQQAAYFSGYLPSRSGQKCNPACKVDFTGNIVENIGGLWDSTTLSVNLPGAYKQYLVIVQLTFDKSGQWGPSPREVLTYLGDQGTDDVSLSFGRAVADSYASRQPTHTVQGRIRRTLVATTIIRGSDVPGFRTVAMWLKYQETLSSVTNLRLQVVEMF